MKFYNPKRLVLFTAHIVLSVLISLLAVGQTASVTPKLVKEPTQMITVQQGQTLADLAELYFGDRRSYKKFLDYNNIADINTLKPGDRLQVPIGKEESRSDRVGKETEQQEKQLIVITSVLLLNSSLFYFVPMVLYLRFGMKLKKKV